MPDPAAPPAAPASPQVSAPAASAQAAPQSPSIPEHYQRAYEFQKQLTDKGYEPSRWDPVIEAFKGRDMDPRFLAQMLAPKPQQGQQPPAGMSAAEVQRLIEDTILSERALNEHNGMVGKHDSYLDDGLKSVWGEDAPDENLNPILRDAAAWRLHQMRRDEKNAYPKDHRLHGMHLPPIKQEWVPEVFKGLAEARKKMTGAQMAAIGRRAASAQPSAPSSKSGGQGKPDKAGPEGPIPFREMTRDQKIAAVQERTA